MELDEQLFVVASRSIRPSDFEEHGVLPELGTSARVYKFFKPTKCVLSESIEATFRGDSLPDKTIIEHVTNNDDIMLWQVYCGADNCFPCEPAPENCIPGAVFAANSVGNEVSWPSINPGINFTIGFLIDSSVLSRVQAQSGYDPTPKRIIVRIRCYLYGRSA